MWRDKTFMYCSLFNFNIYHLHYLELVKRNNKVDITRKITLLNKIKKRKNVLELTTPKLFKKKEGSSNISSHEDISSAVTSGVISPTSVVENITKGKKKKDSTSIVSEKNYKALKTKSKTKLQDYRAFDEEDVTKSNVINVNRSQRKTLAGKKSKVRIPYSLHQNDTVELPKEIKINNPIAVKSLAGLMKKTEAELIKFLFLKGIPVTINEIIDLETINLIANNFDIQVITEEDIAQKTKNHNRHLPDLDSNNNLETRAPIVAVLGHVDHGKTSLIDRVRASQTVKEEAGGITQIISAYNVIWEYKGKSEEIVFLDTPGHAAFSQMRVRGASIMDIAILVVASDDIIQPQTVESIRCIQSAEVPMIVAITKIDKETSNLERVKEELADYNIISEEWGGDTIFVPLSSLTGENIDKLLDSIVLLGSIQNLRASINSLGRGVVIETNIDKSKGIAATVLVNNGTFHRGDIITSHTTLGKVKMLTDGVQNIVSSAGPSQVVKIWGFTSIPLMGELVVAHSTEKAAKSSIKEEQLYEQAPENQEKNNKFNWIDVSAVKNSKVLNLIIKSSTQGSLEAVLKVLYGIPQNKVTLKVVSATLGEITETDVILASTTKAIIVGFDTNLGQGTRQAANRMEILIKEHSVIYDLIDTLEEYMCSLLDPEYEKVEIGQAQVKDIFELARGKVAGCYVKSGKLIHHCNIQVIRDTNIIYEGELDSLKRVKEDIEEINSGNECGIFIKDFQDWQKQDMLRAFELNEKQASLT
uniref:translation initiation factor 2 n=1 Tax=Goniotrichopsis reniformis TaxID=468933 RepID=UPI001FCCF691|nr:translation initiation factor 2 [Goniotrichopsis reniformis]UNJ14792.1 translation initiation factor 2 [Goniotrichopsis reniformis]